MNVSRVTKKAGITIMERLLARSLLMPTGCIEFQGCRTKGYGQLNVDKSRKLAHRLAWEVWKGPVPDGLHVLHRCDNPPCLNVEHLFLGTDADNQKDKVEKGRQLRGESHLSSLLTQAAVTAIRRDYLPGIVRETHLASKYGVHVVTISDVLRNVTWKESEVWWIQPPRHRKLTRAIASDIRVLHAAGTTQANLARTYGIDGGQISRIVTRKAWV